MASAVPVLGGKALENAVRAYEAGQTHNAQVASPDPPGLWRSFGRPTAENAETAALENCQINYGRRVLSWRSTIPCSRSRQTAAGLARTCRGPGIPAASSRHKFRERHQPFAIGRTLSITEPHRLPRQPPSPGRRSRFYGCPGGQPTRGRGGEPRCLRCRPPPQEREWFVFPLCRRRSGGPAVAPLCSNDNTAGSARFVLAPGCTFGRVGIGGAQSKREDQRGTSARL